MARKKIIYCENCGQPLGENDNFCTECGGKVELKEEREIKEEVVKEEIKEKPPEKAANPKPHKPKKHGYAFLYVLGCMVFFFAGAYCMYRLLNIKTEGGNIIVDKLLKEVTIVDNGISEAVDKIYDSVVVVENVKNNSLAATGTGFVYKKDNGKGYILTNNHVISGASEIYVTFTNGVREKVELVGSDEFSDVALLSVASDKIIKVAEIGKSADIKLGDTAFAIGAPLDYQVYSWSVTRGIISGKDRLVEVSLSNTNTNDYVMKVLQTDTAINSGNSGGPLCNSNGEVIGITNMKLASTSVEGMGFAIPIEDAVEYAESFIAGKTIIRPYLGISMYDVQSLKNNIFNRYTLNTDLDEGVYIASIDNNSAAYKAGLQVGDIITKIDNQDTKSSAYLRYVLYQHHVGDKIEITYYRNNKENKVMVTLTSNGKSL